MPPAAGYDPKIIERFAEQLLRKADTVRVGCAVGGGIFGVFVGAVPLTPLRSVWGVPASFGVATIIVGALLGILIGYVVGEGRAFRYRVQAQSAIFQLEIERRVSAAVTEAVAGVAAAPASAPAVEPVPAPAVEPVPEPAPTPPVSPPPLSPVAEPVPAPEPLLRPPEPLLPPVSPRPEEPPLSPAANG
jgi:outer membrane biosynthesis protein TonB